ncbi:MAG: S-methyl-5'-thioadenosine phosphorylase [Marmoricola sp.]
MTNRPEAFSPIDLGATFANVNYQTECPDTSVAIIGGTGFYDWFAEGSDANVAAVRVETPFGDPSAPITIGSVGHHRVAFLPRHGLGHEHAPHAINYRANIWALRSLGVQQILAPCAVGGLSPTRTARGALVIPDQLVDRTTGRAQTFVSDGATHVPFADPYCSRLKNAIVRSSKRLEEVVTQNATMVVIDGPRFSTRAESSWYASQRWDLVNMTGHPEAVLAREMQICYATLALVTDLDAGLAPGEGVSEREVYRVFSANLPRVSALLERTISTLPDPAGCSCSSWADGREIAFTNPAPARSVGASQ